jgi:hypothetical protein
MCIFDGNWIRLSAAADEPSEVYSNELIDGTRSYAASAVLSPMGLDFAAVIKHSFRETKGTSAIDPQ